MKLLSWILIFTFTTQVFAGTVQQDLTTALNDYEYNMVVEWDQKDMKKAESFNQQFADSLAKLFDKGLTQEQLLSAIETRSNNKTKFNELKAKANLLGQSATDARNIANLLQRELSGMGQRGASWNGQVVQYAMAIVPLVLLGALLIYKHIWNQTHRCAEASREESCTFVCDDVSYSESNNCDLWGQNCSSGEYCVRGHDECGLVEVCQEWEKIP